MRCDMCHEYWAIQELCPDCWVEFIEMMVEQDWACSDCGEPVKIKVIPTAEGNMIQQVSCSTCRVAYRPA